MKIYAVYEGAATPIQREGVTFEEAKAIAQECYEYESALGNIGSVIDYQVIADDGMVLYSALGNPVFRPYE